MIASRAGTWPIWPNAKTIEEAVATARETDPHPIVIGGAEVYRAALPHVTRILLTEIDRDVDGDTVFRLDRTGFVETERRAGETPGVSFVTLERAPIAPGRLPEWDISDADLDADLRAMGVDPVALAERGAAFVERLLHPPPEPDLEPAVGDGAAVVHLTVTTPSAWKDPLP